MDGNLLSEELNSLYIPGVFFRPVNFKPFYSIFKNNKCKGVQLIISDKKIFKPFYTNINIAVAIQKLFPDSNYLEKGNFKSFDKAAGTDQIRKLILAGKTADEIVQTYQNDLDIFKLVRKKYLLYN